MKKSLFLTLMLVGGCSNYNYKPMANDEIIKETKKCKDADMKALVVWNSDYCTEDGVKEIICVPK